ncbi:MAG: mandelate racemase/muconate lactonizing enzyme family protein [Alphaproteobacteria bacterium]|nr:mandelate racemase/muconate lactonizing enzyme family protein [Alphaproteobacteria bacterium]
MKITHIEPILIELPYDHGAPKPFLRSGTPRTMMDAVYLRVDTDEGISGWGEAFGFGACRIAHAAAEMVVAPLAIGQQVDDISTIMGDLNRKLQSMALNGPVRFALSALDIALWDIAGKIAKQPIHRLLNPKSKRTQLPVYASLMRIQDAEYVAKVSADAAGRGYRHIKLHERTLKCVAAARNAIGSDVALMLDTNCAWSVDEAIDMGQKMADQNLFWLEEPISPPDDYDGLARVQVEGGIPVAAGENLGTFQDFRRLVETPSIEYLQPDVTKFGGITEMWKAVTFAVENNCCLEPHSPLYGPGLIATQHIVAAMEEEAMVEFYYCDLAASPMGEGIYAKDGLMTVPGGPGLGVEPNVDIIEKYRVA